MEVVIKWSPGQSPVNHIARVGKWEVGHSNWRVLKSQADQRKYVARVTLPGLKEVQGYYENSDEAKAKVETAIRHWFNHIE